MQPTEDQLAKMAATKQDMHRRLNAYLTKEIEKAFSTDADLPELSISSYMIVNACLKAVAKCILIITCGTTPRPRDEMEHMAAEGVRLAADMLTGLTEEGFLALCGKPDGATVQ